MKSVGILSRLDPEIEARFDEIRVLSETRNRARGALMLFCDAHGREDAWRDEAYIRGGLNEFYSIGDAVAREHRTARFAGKARKPEDSRNPLIHLMLLLRHVNVHTQTCSVARHQTTVMSHLGEPHEYTYTAAVISNLSVDQLLGRRREAARSYERADLERAVAWFVEKQKVFGVHEVFIEGTELYCHELLRNY